MHDRVHYLTPDGLKKVREELEHLTTVKRLEIAERLSFAIQQGDISENADYEVAKEEQAFYEIRIKDLESILRRARIIEDDLPNDEVQVGNRVTIMEPGFEPETYHIVGSPEAAPETGRISYESPVGAALIGRRVGDTVSVETPAGELALKIVEIA